MSNVRPKGVKAHSLATHAVHPQSSLSATNKHFQTAGEILNYPYSFDAATLNEETIALDNKLAKQIYEEQYKIAEIQNQQLYSPVKEEFNGAKEFG